ncbi:hypothetical protein [uncultured Deefgea sp.]|uniref:hypothetical protein n=1 Tax=uncultured Deefgea sp. TaxID=1304914 RepID=UPI0026028F37|nr:hypothetical protein [uncultured Deefgea sp.]
MKLAINTPPAAIATPHWRWLLLLSVILHAAVLIGWPSIEPTPPAQAPLVFTVLATPIVKQPSPTTTAAPAIKPQPRTRPAAATRTVPVRSATEIQANPVRPKISTRKRLSASSMDAAKPASQALNLALPSEAIQPERQQLVQRTQKPVPLNTQLNEHETTLSKDLKKATRRDCRHAYRSMGLLAIPFLIKDSVNDEGCDW